MFSKNICVCSTIVSMLLIEVCKNVFFCNYKNPKGLFPQNFWLPFCFKDRNIKDKVKSLFVKWFERNE
jgi:hypothetical protein